VYEEGGGGERVKWRVKKLCKIVETKIYFHRRLVGKYSLAKRHKTIFILPLNCKRQKTVFEVLCVWTDMWLEMKYSWGSISGILIEMRVLKIKDNRIIHINCNIPWQMRKSFLFDQSLSLFNNIVWVVVAALWNLTNDCLFL
jgi:hypothetical protein